MNPVAAFALGALVGGTLTTMVCWNVFLAAVGRIVQRIVAQGYVVMGGRRYDLKPHNSKELT